MPTAKIKKQFIVRKYVMATTAAEAIRLEKHQCVDDVWVDDDWKKNQPNQPLQLGFKPKKK